ncbi:MAG: glutamate 5-kinase [Planctomycetales bacterium]|nr:glutamate 5-kinase [Planctomycetales bacterium]
MTLLLRQEAVATADVVVVKVGSRVLTGPDGLLDQQRVADLAEELARAADAGRKVVLVSSGAVAAGMGQMGLKQRPADLAHLQAASAIGQSHLIQAYDRAFKRHRRHAAQLLLTADGLHDRTRYLNVRNTLLALLENGAIPIVNENDTVSVEELQLSFGDNDRLAAMVTNLIGAQLLILLSDIDGLYDRDPAQPDAQRIALVNQIDEAIISLVVDRKTGLSKGGMASKLAAAKIATDSGENVIIANGHQRGILTEVLAGADVGTLFLATGQSVRLRKRWIGFAVQVQGRVTVDAGARRAIVEQGRSLLAIGVVECEGNFKKGDPIAICGPDGQEFARGMINYSREEILKIRGLKATKIAAMLGHCPYDEVVHRDNMSVSADG